MESSLVALHLESGEQRMSSCGGGGGGGASDNDWLALVETMTGLLG